MSEVIINLKSQEIEKMHQGLHVLAKSFKSTEKQSRLMSFIDELIISIILEFLDDTSEEVLCDSLVCINAIIESSKSDLIHKKCLFVHLDKLLMKVSNPTKILVFTV